MFNHDSAIDGKKNEGEGEYQCARGRAQSRGGWSRAASFARAASRSISGLACASFTVFFICMMTSGSAIVRSVMVVPTIATHLRHRSKSRLSERDLTPREK